MVGNGTSQAEPTNASGGWCKWPRLRRYGRPTPQAGGASGRPRRAEQSKELTPQVISEQGLHQHFGKQAKRLTDDVSGNDQETIQADKNQDSDI